MNLKVCMMCISRCVLNNFNNKRFKFWKNVYSVYYKDYLFFGIKIKFFFLMGE